MHLSARLLGKIENLQTLKCSARLMISSGIAGIEPAPMAMSFCASQPHRFEYLLAHRYKDHASSFTALKISPIEHEAVLSTFSDTAAILGEHAVPAEWNAWIKPEVEPYARARTVLENRRQYRKPSSSHHLRFILQKKVFAVSGKQDCRPSAG